MPLISGGALAAFAKQFGIRLPAFLSGKGSRDLGKSMGRGGYYGSKGYGEEESPLGGLGGLGNIAGMMGGGGNIGSVLSLAKNFL